MAHTGGQRRSLLAISKEDGALAIGISMAVLSALGAVALAFSVLHILKKYPKALTRMLVFIQVGVPLILGVVALACGVWPGFIVQVIIAGIAGIFLYLWRQQLALASQMLSVTASAVQENPSVVWVSVGLNLVTFVSYLCILALVAVTFIGGLYVVPGDFKEIRSVPDVGDRCFACPMVQNQDTGESYVPKSCDAQQLVQTNCCSVDFKDYGKFYSGMAGLYLVWFTALIFAIRQYTIGGAVGQWYFSAPGTDLKGNVMRSFRHATGPSLGSVSFAGAIITLLDIIRQQKNRAANRAMSQGGCMAVFACMFSGLVEIVMQLVETLTEYAVIHVAITGQTLIESGKQATQMLKRNLGDAAGMWMFPRSMMGMLNLVLALSWSILMGVATAAVSAGLDTDQQVVLAWIIGVGSFILSLVILFFFSGIILNATTAVFLCYVIDKENAAVTREQIHEVFAQMPLKGDKAGSPKGFGGPYDKM